ncbi:MAG: VOC family protein [Candidatus Rokubacteria bacterium]|nr:VOC family protein [Candidatus Rokubacteria bacterium]
MPDRLRVTELGHVSLFVRDLEASIHFYRDVLGLKDVGRGKGGRIAFFSAGPHHHDLSIELARIEGPTHASGAGTRPKGAPGLYHIAFQLGTTLEELAEARRWVEAHGLEPFGEMEGRDSASFSIPDPDGHEIELYVDLRRTLEVGDRQ